MESANADIGKTTAPEVTARGSESSDVALPWLLRKWLQVVDCVSYNLFGGPRCICLSHIINFQKGGTLLMCLFLMHKSKNTSITAATYTALHGSYGLCWLLKEHVFPDPKWQVNITVGSAVCVFSCVLGPYWYIAYRAVVGQAHRTPLELCGAIIVYALGLSLMMGSDCQKYFVLKKQRGLITDGFFARVRHPNYLGEMMLYGAFAYVSNDTGSWAILGLIWSGVFLPYMLRKEARMSRHAGWAAYRARTGMLIPCFTAKQ
ncbi:hypothetical protein STCU_02690 [Strigomonas culicis]|uniref:Uncharacterized protein n=2 Tax=Strigomonas culicis TaxID=28005 RepID=S9UPD1_9TRYP|nr:hypothetical protein STCU_06161 [Strigomonas culicis]EPY31427.1 hypothetical protein STCU_03461 [Strigomonas culicis]EPY32747.1 hypothetical protein STCU_02690 [Strigomonas culicis]|eukprot:EPY26625.1 hypothetical protein STCU_06161 [Strigomonas culicis]